MYYALFFMVLATLPITAGCASQRCAGNAHLDPVQSAADYCSGDATVAEMLAAIETSPSHVAAARFIETCGAKSDLMLWIERVDFNVGITSTRPIQHMKAALRPFHSTVLAVYTAGEDVSVITNLGSSPICWPQMSFESADSGAFIQWYRKDRVASDSLKRRVGELYVANPGQARVTAVTESADGCEVLVIAARSEGQWHRIITINGDPAPGDPDVGGVSGPMQMAIELWRDLVAHSGD